jgi:hypothetical protein
LQLDHVGIQEIVAWCILHAWFAAANTIAFHARWPPFKLLLLRLLPLHARAADGNVYLYDLASRQRLIRPVAQLHMASSSSSSSSHPKDRRSGARGSDGGVQGVNALAYNAVVPSTLAAAAGDQVKVRVAWPN